MAGRANSNLAILIDGDNVSPKFAAGLLAEVANYGTASVKRVYGDWTGPSLKGWKDALQEYSLQPIQQFANLPGKNATDSALIIDAMDLLYTGRFGGFCIVSSDSDFTRLASRLREQGVTVYGFGKRETHKGFIAACDKFVYFDVLGGEANAAAAEREAAASAEAGKPASTPAERVKPVLKMLKAAVEASSDEDGWSHLGAVGTLLVKQRPDFDSRNYGFKQLSELANASGILEVKRIGDQKVIMVRLKGKPVNKGP